MIAIKDMKMPQKCYDCRFAALQLDGIDGRYYCAAQEAKWPVTFIEERSAKNNKPSWCPLIEVPEVAK